MEDSILDKVIAAKLSEEVQKIHTSDILDQLLGTLAAREREVLVRRFGLQNQDAQTLKEIGAQFAITRERVRQIESHALGKLRLMSRDASVSQHVDPVIHTTIHVMEEHGGILARHHLWELVCHLSSLNVNDERARTSFEFMVEHLLADRVDPLAENKQRHCGWKLHFVDGALWEKTIASAEALLNQVKEPVGEDRLFKELSASLPEVDPKVLRSHMLLSKTIRPNFFGHWGFSHWNIVVPRRVNDKIYLILKKEKTPLHFTEITKRINEAGFDKKVAYPSTVHNELILDSTYVLVGRGMYALQEWGYKPGVVSDVIAEVMKGSANPMDREAIVGEVLKRRIVRKSTILLALTDRNRFDRMPDGRYTLAPQDQPVISSSV